MTEIKRYKFPLNTNEDYAIRLSIGWTIFFVLNGLNLLRTNSGVKQTLAICFMALAFFVIVFLQWKSSRIRKNSRTYLKARHELMCSFFLWFGCFTGCLIGITLQLVLNERSEMISFVLLAGISLYMTFKRIDHLAYVDSLDYADDKVVEHDPHFNH